MMNVLWLYRDINWILALSWHHIKLSWMPWLSMGRADWWRRADGADGADGAVTPIQQRWVRAAGRRSHSFFCRPEKTWRMKPRHWRDRTINPGINPTRSSEKKNPEEPSTLWISRQNRSSRTRPVSREKRSALLFFNRTEVVVCGRGSAEVRQRLSLRFIVTFTRLLQGSGSVLGLSELLGGNSWQGSRAEWCLCGQSSSAWDPVSSRARLSVLSVLSGSDCNTLIPEQRCLLKLVSGQKYRNNHYYQVWEE